MPPTPWCLGRVQLQTTRLGRYSLTGWRPRGGLPAGLGGHRGASLSDFVPPASGPCSPSVSATGQQAREEKETHRAVTDECVCLCASPPV